MEERPINVVVRLRPPVGHEETVSTVSHYVNEHENSVVWKDASFTYDKVFPASSNNRMIYDAVCSERIKQVVDGFNVTILAYGSTGSGKTYTMGTASNSEVGLIPLGLQDIFETTRAIQDTTDVTVKISFYELYMQHIIDLLQKGSYRPVCSIQGEKGNLKIINLVEETISSPEEGILLLDQGSRARKTECTAKNEKSSRSHAIFAVTVISVDKATNITKKAKFQLVDLAGSERQRSSQTDGEKFKQGIFINQGLSALVRVIDSLCKQSKHIPYRDSCLTRILQDTFGGNSYAVMIACISPAISSADESLRTLKYADQTRSVKNCPMVNKETKEKLIESLRRQISWYEAQFRRDKDPKSLQVSSESSMNFFKMTLKLATMNEQLTKAIENRKDVAKKISYIYDSIQSAIAELTSHSITDPSVKDHLRKIELIQEEISKLICQESSAFRLILSDVSPNVSLTSSGEVIPSSFETESDNVSEEYDENVTEDKKRRLAENVVRIETIENTILMKESEAEACQKFSALYNTFSEVPHNELLERIQALVDEKKCLIEKNDTLIKSQEMKDKFAQEKEDRIKALELEINNLHDVLDRSQVLLKLKKDNKEKEERLLQEIQLLKNSKTQLLKKMKNVAIKQQSQLREETKKVAFVEKQQRQSELKLAKLKSSFENQVKVLQQKVDAAQAASKRVTQRSNLRETKVDAAKKEQLAEDTIGVIDKLYNEALLKEARFCLVETYEKEVVYLEGQLHCLEDTEEGSVKDTALEQKESRAEEIKNSLSMFKNAISELYQEIIDMIDKEPERWNFLKNLPMAKTAMEHLFNKCIDLERIDVQEFIRIEYVEKAIEIKEIKKDFNSQINKFVARIEQLEKVIKQKELEHLRQKSAIECDWESKILTMIELTKKTKSEPGRTDSPMMRHLQELADHFRARSSQDTYKELYDQKCQELEKLKEKMSNKTKAPKIYLPPLSDDCKQSKQDDKDMTLAFLLESEDSFSVKEDDDKDPDFRGTPLDRRKILKRKPEENLEKLHLSPPKKTHQGCKCPNAAACSSIGCWCYRRRMVCTYMCDCAKFYCLNLPSCSKEEDRRLSDEID